MQVVAHQHIGMHLNLVRQGLVFQQTQHALAVGAVAKNVLTVVAPQDDVVRVVWEGEAGQAGHAGMLSTLGSDSN
jgi:hypothetical protein